jgi:protein TonB
MTRDLSFQRIFFLVLAAHLALVFVIYFAGGGLKPFRTFDPITPVELIGGPAEGPAAVAGAPKIMEAPAPLEDKDVIVEKKTPSQPKKITKRIKIEKTLPESDLRKRLESRLSQEKTPALTARPGSAGGMVGGMPGGTGRFSSSWYSSYVSTRLYTLWKQPSSAMAKKTGVTSLVSFRVYRDGHIEGVRLTQSSGFDLMDQSAVQAVKMADPLPPLPNTYSGKYENFDILFELTK